VATRLADQAAQCARLGSHLYAEILSRAAADAQAGGITAGVLAGHADDPPGSALALRFLAALHRRVLLGEAPQLARHYPSVGGRAGPRGVWPAVAVVLRERTAVIARDVCLPCQTNEVGRCAPLLAGLLHIAAVHPALPVRLWEIGASAGLNLYVDRYRVGRHGPAGAPIVAERPWRGRGPATAPPVITARAGCDPEPVDPRTPGGKLTLASSVWADQRDRSVRLRRVLDAVADWPFLVERSPASDWLRERLAVPAPQPCVTVVWHSVVWQYLSEPERVAVSATLERAGARATGQRPLVRLYLEPELRDKELGFALRARRWPGPVDEHLADAAGHGPPVRFIRPPR
jgi:hypothetical protein